MLNLFDMLNQSQNGNGMEALARQFNLSQQQTQAAVEALLPAFSQGLKRNTADPYGVGNFMSAMATGQYGQYFDNAAQAFSPQGVQQGNDVLGQLFGSKDLSRAVAAQAAQASGVGQQVLQQMLPVLASMVMGGLFKQTTNQMQAGGFSGGGGISGNPLGQIIEEMMRQGGGMGGGMMGGQPQQRQAPQSQNPFGNNPLGDNPLGKVLQDMFGGGAPQQAPQQPQPQNPFGDNNPWGKILQDMRGWRAADKANGFNCRLQFMPNRCLHVRGPLGFKRLQPARLRATVRVRSTDARNVLAVFRCSGASPAPRRSQMPQSSRSMGQA